ncbi:glycosyltransferase family 4 protein [Anabaena sphaerica FACHB-251]|uniref:Glycosyltransferase family 4 protein n=1 Tax=Anabaena sphaerica FACHB-251 TaxID=2692883 RepID=A0A926WMK0_9NOST|nr:glycosyltransferase family 4 protein [Anabaena sphaerica]MBD2296755.1 glycosyltransferase family 4 protein [Anabaena sphaerica FACHB-251]
MTKVILTGFSHIINHNAPKFSKYELIRPKEFPFGRFPLKKFWYPLSSLAAWQPVNKSKIIHSFNAIPYTTKPFIVSYEIFLPHIMSSDAGYSVEKLRKFLRDRLVLDNCIRLLASSNFARKKFILKNAGWEKLDQVLQKTEVIPPNTILKVSQPKTYTDTGTLNLMFVGNHIARKGGIVALRVAKKAKLLGLPVIIHIASSLSIGRGIPTDCPDISHYDNDLKLLELDNVRFYNQLPNQEVINLLAQSDFQILATLQDAYAFSIIEGCSVATPAIATPIFAIPEWIRDGDNGYLLKLELDNTGEWKWRQALCSYSVSVDEHWEILDKTYENLAEQIITRLGEFIERRDRKEHYEQLSYGALAQGKIHDSKRVSELIDSIYSEAILSQS